MTKPTDPHDADFRDRFPPGLQDLDRELSAIRIEERPSFGPELEGELLRVWRKQTEGEPRKSRPWMRTLLAAGVAGLMIAGVSVPSARAAVRQLAQRVVQEATRIFSEPEPEIPVELPRIEAQEPTTPPAPEPRAEVVVSPVDASEDVETSQPDFPTLPPVSITFPEIASRQRAAEIIASHYPLDLQEAGVEGTVKLLFWVDAQGNAENIEVRESSGSQRLDYAAMRSVREIQFNPATRNGVGVGTWVVVDVHFFALSGMGIIGSDSTDSGT